MFFYELRPKITGGLGSWGEKERNSRRQWEAVGRFLDNWELVGSLGGRQNGWEMKTSVSRSDVHSKWPWNPADNLKYGQIVIMLYAFSGDLDQISSFASNYEPITLPIHPKSVMGMLRLRGYVDDFFLERRIAFSWSLLTIDRFAFSHTCCNCCLPFSPISAPWLSLISGCPPISD